MTVLHRFFRDMTFSACMTLNFVREELALGMVCSCAPRLLQIRPAFACCAFETGHFGPGHLGAKPVAASETNLAPTKWLLKFSQLRSYSGRTIFWVKKGKKWCGWRVKVKDQASREQQVIVIE